MAVEILNGEKTISDMQVEFQSDITTYYNSLTAEKIGLTLPESIIERGIDVSAE